MREFRMAVLLAVCAFNQASLIMILSLVQTERHSGAVRHFNDFTRTHLVLDT